MNRSRRDFLTTAALAAGFLGLRNFEIASLSAGNFQNTSAVGFGPLNEDPVRTLDLPAGFSYQIISRVGERMNDGLLVPGAHDGMAAFPGRGGKTILIRNHELFATDLDRGPFGADNSLLSSIDASLLYDEAPALGGTTTLVYDTKKQHLDRHYLSLTGTLRNCAGGPTPWGSWITCEESVQTANDIHWKNHGYNFEVSSKTQKLARPIALRSMGRFNHEAIAVDPSRGYVYQTEDRPDGLFYRFTPHQRGRLAAGGRLQALKIQGMEGIDTSNWLSESIAVGQTVPVEWVDLQDVDSPNDDLRIQGFSKGAARFSRGEGIWAGNNVIYFACTTGGRNRAGQIWRYHPGEPGRLQLFVEPNDESILESADCITVAPWGDLIVCEDGLAPNQVVGVTPQGALYTFARNVMNGSEFAGATFSPDRTTLFVNIQNPGLTLAITGPWKRSS
jgi:secreted PhoX family phosphatase